jgi:putative restriction endonuclease
MIEDYIKRFAKLHTDKKPHWPSITFNRAPHKPLLLLALMDLFAQGSITTNLIELTPELGELFAIYWARVVPPGRPGNVVMPFFHLKSEGFWHLVAQRGKEAILMAGYRPQSVNQLRETILGAKLDDELYALLCVEESRNVLRAVLIEKYFTLDVRKILVEQGAVNLEAFHYSRELLEQARTKQVQDHLVDEEEYQTAARDQGFRRAVVTAYDRRCALCGIRVLTPDGHTVVDAAHIVPWSLSHNDNPCNGMALCRLCHWSFDEGLFSVSSQYAVIASPQLSTNRNIPGHLITLVGRGILGPAEQSLWPDLDALTWHRHNVFRKL